MKDAAPALSRDDINALPIRSYEGEVLLVRDPAGLEAALARLRKDAVLGFDTETRPTFRKGKIPAPALIQLAGEDCVVLVQLGRVPFGPALAGLLADPAVIKAGVAIRDDMRALARLHDFTPDGATDLAALARARGLKAQGLRPLAAQLLGFRVSKSAQCSNWENDALTPRQIRYAATDAWVGRELYLRLAARGHEAP